MANNRDGITGSTHSRVDIMIRIDEVWLSTQPMDMRAGTDTALAQVLKAFGHVKPY